MQNIVDNITEITNEGTWVLDVDNYPHQANVKYVEKSIGYRIIIFIKEDNVFYYFYSSPALGTRVATISADKIAFCERIRCILTWSIDGIKLYIEEIGIANSRLHHTNSKQSKVKLRVDDRNNINQFGCEGENVVKILSYTTVNKGVIDLAPNAIDAWIQNIDAIHTLLSSAKTDDMMYECILSNMCISTLVTNFEVYCQRRYIELLQDDIPYDISLLCKRVRDPKLKDQILNRKISKKELSSHIQNNISFQNYESCKTMYRILGVKFGDIGSGKILNQIQRVIEYRHTIIHVEPSRSYLNIKHHDETPIFTSRELVKEYMQLFSILITRLHYCTTQRLKSDKIVKTESEFSLLDS